STFHAASIAQGPLILRKSPQRIRKLFKEPSAATYFRLWKGNFMPAHKTSSTLLKNLFSKLSKGRLLGKPLRFAAAALLLATLATGLAFSGSFGMIIPKFQVFGDPNGAFATINAGGPTDTSTNPFFLSMGTNGRTCVTCHQ